MSLSCLSGRESACKNSKILTLKPIIFKKYVNGNHMCLMLFAHDFHPDFSLVLAANRDEYYARPAAPLDYWQDAPDVLAGRDLKGMGTWLGVTRAGRFSAITNFRDPAAINPHAPSRGHLVSGFLKGADAPGGYMEKIQKEGMPYNGFNLICGDWHNMCWYSNRKGTVEKLLPGLYGMSNRLLDTPWPKVERGKKQMGIILQQKGQPDVEAIFALLADRSCPPDDALPDTGVGIEMERMLAPLFITSPAYGTRCSSVLLMEKTGKIVFYERSFQMAGENITTGETRQYTIDPW